MADVILTAAGQVAGAAIGGPIGAAIGGAIGGAIGRTFTPTQKAQGPRLGDLRVTGTEYGQPIPWVAGSPRISGQIIWASSKREIANTRKQGKGGGGGSQLTTFTYEVDVAYLLSENEIAGVSRIWSNGELVYDGLSKAGVWAGIAIYTGADDQMPDPTIEAFVGVGNTPAYRGRGYIVIRSLQLGGSGQLPNLTFEVGTSTGSILVVAVGTQVTANLFTNFVSGMVPTITDPEVMTFIRTDYDSNYASTQLTQCEVNVVTGATATLSTWSYNPALTSSSFRRPIARFNNTTNRIFIRGNPPGVTGGALAFGPGDVTGVRFEDPLPGVDLFQADTGCESPSGTNVYIGGGTAVGNRLFGFPGGGGGIFATSPTLPGPIYTAIATVDEVYVAFTGPNTVNVYNSNLGFLKTINRPSFGTAASDNAPVLFRVGSDICMVSANAASTRKLWKLLPDDTWLELGNDPAGGDNLWMPCSSQDYICYSIGAQSSSSFLIKSFEVISSTNNTVITDPIPLEDVSSNLLSRAGYNSAQYDVQEIEDAGQIVRAMALSQVAGTRSALELLQGAYFFEAAKTDVIQIFPRQSTAVATIPYADLGFSFDGGDQEQFVLTNSNDLELPAQISVQYANMLADYQAGAEFSDRLLTEQESTSVVQLALGLLPVEAKTIADKLLSDLIAGQWRFTIKLPLKYAYLMPGDIFNVVARDGRSFRGRVQQKKDLQVLLELECVLDDVGTLNVDAATDANYVAQTVRQVADTEWETLDIPILRDADNNVSYYSALTPIALTNTQWPGGVIVQSFGGAFDQVYTTGDRSAIGECDTVLGDWTHGAMFDETNSLTVTLYAGELESVTRANILLDQELNAAAVGADGRWEIIRFRNAELTGQTSGGLNIYRLSGLLRGQRGTEWAIPSHEVDDRFVLLDSTIRVINSQTNELNIEREIKGVTFNFLLDDVTGRMFTHTGVGLTPFSVAQLRALPSGSDIDVTWNRRTRLSYRYAGINPVVPLGEATEAYRVWVYDGSTLVRTENVTTNSYTYTAANIASDGFASSDTIRIEVAQVSAIVGAGYIEEVEVIAP